MVRVLNNTHFERMDESEDSHFYRKPRLNSHVDSHARSALEEFLYELLPTDGDVLDLMAGYNSHIRNSSNYRQVIGLGLNKEELLQNKHLTQRVLQDINLLPTLPFQSSFLDAVLISFAVQYLTKPYEIFEEMGRILQPGGICCISYSQRMFLTKSVSVWKVCSDADRARLIAEYFEESKLFENIRFDEVTPEMTDTDPAYVISANRNHKTA